MLTDQTGTIYNTGIVREGQRHTYGGCVLKEPPIATSAISKAGFVHKVHTCLRVTHRSLISSTKS